MAISVECSACGQSYRLKDEMAGRRIRCKACQTPIEVPLSETEEEWGETSWPANGSGRGGASRKAKVVQKKSGNGKSVLVVIGGVAGLALIVALVWGLLNFLPSGDNQLADGTPAPTGSSWVKFTLPDGSASALFPGEVQSAPALNGAMIFVAIAKDTAFAMSDKSPMEVTETYLEDKAKPADDLFSPDPDTTSSLETINGNRCLRETRMKDGELHEVSVTFVHNRRIYLASIQGSSQKPLSTADVDYFLKSVTFH